MNVTHFWEINASFTNEKIFQIRLFSLPNNLFVSEETLVYRRKIARPKIGLSLEEKQETDAGRQGLD